MSKFIIEKHEDEMPEDAVNWLYSNMELIEDLNLFGEVGEIANQLTDHTGDTVTPAGLGEEIIFDDNDLPF